MKTLVKNGNIITAGENYFADILIEDGIISAIARTIPETQADTIIDAGGLYVLPGGVDVHTHLEMPFNGTVTIDDWQSGTQAAAWGGTTTIVDFAQQQFGGSLPQALQTWWHKAEGKAVIDYSFHMVIREMNDQVLTDMDQMVRDEGVTSFKLFMAYPGELMLDDAAIFKAMRRTAKNGGLLCIHAENGSVIDIIIKEALAEGKTGPKYHSLTRPTLAESEATHRAIALSEIAGVPIYFVHLSCTEALEVVQEARDKGLPTHAETCPHYLFLSIEEYDRPEFEGAKYVMTPPLREKHHQDALWKGLRGNDLQVISTDHCPFCFREQKEMGLNNFSKIPQGAPGIENRLSLVYDGGVRAGRISLNRFVELVSANPARMMGLYPKKGTIAIGSDGDIVIFDPNAKMTINASTQHSKIDYSLFEGREVFGVPITVLLRGLPVIQNRQFVGKPGTGQFIKRHQYQLV